MNTETTLEDSMLDAAMSWVESHGINVLEPEQLSSLVSSLYIAVRDASLIPQQQATAPSDTARDYMTGYSDAKEWAKPSQALVVEPVYQYQLANGNWIDQTKESYDYNVKHGQATVRMLYATPQAAPLYTKEQQ